jgi:hypothetical protein
VASDYDGFGNIVVRTGDSFRFMGLGGLLDLNVDHECIEPLVDLSHVEQ